MLGPTLLPYSLFFLFTIILYRFRILPARKFLTGLTVYAIPNAKEALEAAAAQKAAQKAAQQRGSAKKRPSKAQVVDTSSSIPVGGSQLTESVVERLEFYDHVDMLLNGAFVLGLVALSQLSLEHLGLTPLPVSRACLTQLLPAYAAYLVFCLLHVEFIHDAVPKADRVALVFMAVLLAAVALVATALAPPGTLTIDAAAAAADLSEGWVPAAARRLRHAPSAAAAAGRLGAALGGKGIAVALSLAGGLVGALMLGPGWRYGRLVAATATPKCWEDSPLAPGLGLVQTALLRVGFVLNLLVCALWVGPLVYVLHLSAGALRALQLGVLGACALVNLVAARTLVQAHLNNGFSNWFTILHSSGVDDASKVRQASQRTKLVIYLSGKVALQMVALPALQFAALLLLLLHALPSGAARSEAAAAAAHASEVRERLGGGGDGAAAVGPEDIITLLRSSIPELAGRPGTLEGAAAAAEAAAAAALPSALVEAVAGFLAWWAACCYCAFSVLSVMLIRMGIMTSLTAA